MGCMSDVHPRWPAFAAGVLLAVGLAQVATAVVAGIVSGVGWARLVDLLVVSNAVLGFSLAVSGWPIAVRRPRNPVGWLLLAGGCSYPSTAAGMALLATLDGSQVDQPGWRVVATLANAGWSPSVTVFLPLALLLFPHGRLPGRHWRWLVPFAILNGCLLWGFGTVSSKTLSQELGVQGYLAWPAWDDLGWLYPVVMAAIPITYGAALAALVLRFRRGSSELRQQLLWVLLALVVVITVFALDPLLPDSVLSILPIALIPMSITVAVLRYRLLDIRVVFSRSVVFLLLTTGAAGAYVGLVALFDHLVRTTFPAAPSVAATLVVAIAFNPVRVRLQRLVDRGVYGARKDPAVALAAVGARLGEVADSKTTGLTDVLETLCRVLRLPYAAIVLDGTQVAAHGQSTAASHATPLIAGDEHLGELIVGLRGGESRLDPIDERLLSLLSAPLAIAVRARELADDLADSREQVISAREEERRLLRRDLHDGLGPLLTGVVLNAETALRSVKSDPERAMVLLGQLRDQTTSALDDIRRLVYGLRPPALDSLGLVAALEEFAIMLSRRADGEPLTVFVTAARTFGPLPAAVEVAAYRIATEALTNVTRHSNASSAEVIIAEESDSLHVGVHDDGVNVHGWQAGVGLTSIRERAAELGGRAAITSDRTGGQVDVYLPLPVTIEPTPRERLTPHPTPAAP